MATPAQIEANRRNALKSTGPKTPEGKDRARRNALDHGLAAKTLVPEAEAAEVARRTAELEQTLRPRDAFERLLVGRIAHESARAGRCGEAEAALRCHLAERAELCWDDDRRIDADRLARGLARRPTEVSRQLERTPQGCDWKAERWLELGQSAATNGPWDAARRALALDLLGVPALARDLAGTLPDDPEAQAALAATEALRLDARAQGAIGRADENDRVMSTRGYAAEVGLSADLNRLRRYETSAMRRVEWAVEELARYRQGKGASAAGLAFMDAANRPIEASPEPPVSRPIAPPPVVSRPVAIRTAEPMLAMPTTRGTVAAMLAGDVLGPPAGNRRARRAAQRMAG